jgi:hypothetical protein
MLDSHYEIRDIKTIDPHYEFRDMTDSLTKPSTLAMKFATSNDFTHKTIESHCEQL